MDFHRINTQGRIWIQRVDDVSLIGHTADDEGRMLYSKSDDKVYIATSTEWLILATKYSVLTAGSTLLFGSYPLPTGWNITSYNDAIVSITNSSGSVGSFSGGWTITGFGAAGTHDHGGYATYDNDWMRVTQGGLYRDDLSDYEAPSYIHKHSIVSDGNHTHTFNGTWRPSNMKFCEAILQ